MYVTIASIVLILSLMFGGTGATVLAAQGSLPNQSLYQVKTFSEDLALRFSQRDSQRLQMELEYASRRVNEMVVMAEMGVEPPDAVLMRLENHLDQVIAIAARTGEAEMTRALSQIRDRLQQQIRSLDEAPAVGPLMTKTKEAIQLRLCWAELGLNEPKAFLEQAHIRNRFNQPPEFGEDYGSGSSAENGPTSYGPGPGSGNESPGYESGPNMENDPPGYSPGPGPNPDQEPGDCGFEPGPNPDCSQEPRDGGYETDPNPNPGQEPENGGDKSEPGSNQNCPDPNPDPELHDKGSNTPQDSGDGSGKEKGNKP